MVIIAYAIFNFRDAVMLQSSLRYVRDWMEDQVQMLFSKLKNLSFCPELTVTAIMLKNSSYWFSRHRSSHHPMHSPSSIFDSTTAWRGRGQARRRVVIGLRIGVVDEVINPKRLLIGGEKCTLLVHWVHGIHRHHSL